MIGTGFAGVLVAGAVEAGIARPAVLPGLLLAVPAGLKIARAMIAPRAPADAKNDIAMR